MNFWAGIKIYFKFKFKILFLGAMASMLFMASCKVIEPAAPIETSSTAGFKPDVSEVNIPVNISIPGMEASLNKKVQGLLYEDNDLDNNGGDNMMLKVSKKSDISLDVNGDEVSYRLPLDIWVKAGFKFAALGANVSNYEEGNCAIALKFKSRLAIDSLWNVTVVTTPDGYDWISKPVIKLGSLNFPVTFIANRILNAQLPYLASVIDEHARESMHIKKYVEETWRKLQEPIKVSTGPDFWLAIHPVGVHMIPFSGKKGNISSCIGIHAYVLSQLGTKPPVTFSPLPNLNLLPELNNDINISLVSDISYDNATAYASQTLVGQTYTFKDGKYKVTISGVKIYPSHGKLVSKIDLEGSIQGSVYLEGVPYYDTESISMKMKQTDFHLETKNALMKSASWLLHGTFVKRIEPQLTYSLADQLLRAKTLLQQSLKENKITNYILINGTINELVPHQIILTPETIKTIVVAKGKLEVKISGFD